MWATYRIIYYYYRYFSNYCNIRLNFFKQFICLYSSYPAQYHYKFTQTSRTKSVWKMSKKLYIVNTYWTYVYELHTSISIHMSHSFAKYVNYLTVSRRVNIPYQKILCSGAFHC